MVAVVLDLSCALARGTSREVVMLEVSWTGKM